MASRPLISVVCTFAAGSVCPLQSGAVDSFRVSALATFKRSVGYTTKYCYLGLLLFSISRRISFNLRYTLGSYAVSCGAIIATRRSAALCGGDLRVCKD
jgi:hypothetical protein